MVAFRLIKIIAVFLPRFYNAMNDRLGFISLEHKYITNINIVSMCSPENDDIPFIKSIFKRKHSKLLFGNILLFIPFPANVPIVIERMLKFRKLLAAENSPVKTVFHALAHHSNDGKTCPQNDS